MWFKFKHLHVLSSVPSVTLNLWMQIKQQFELQSRQASLLWTTVSLQYLSKSKSTLFHKGNMKRTCRFSACSWLSNQSSNPRLQSPVVAERPKQDRGEGQWTEPDRGLRWSRAVWLHCGGAPQQRPLHPCSHHHPKDGRQRWVTRQESAAIPLVQLCA